MDAAGVLFDVDGTLVDTTFVNAVCWAEALRQQGRPVATRETRDAIGMSGDRLLDRVAPGLDVVLASSATDEELAALTSAIDADDAITASTSSSDVDSGKPAPDILQVALDKTGLDPERVVFVGDAVWDGEAAKRAGVRFVALTCGGTCEADLREAGAVAVFRDPAELLENLDEIIG